MKYILSPTLLTVMRHVPQNQLDNFLNQSFPELFRTKEEKQAHALQLIEEMNNRPAPKPTLGIDEAIWEKREEADQNFCLL